MLKEKVEPSIAQNCSTCKYYSPIKDNSVCQECLVAYVLKDTPEYAYLKWEAKI